MKASAHSLLKKMMPALWGIGIGLSLATIFYLHGVPYPFRPFFLFFAIPTFLVNIINLKVFSKSREVYQQSIRSIIVLFLGVLLPVMVQAISVEIPLQGFGTNIDVEPLTKVLHYFLVIWAALVPFGAYISISSEQDSEAEREKDDNDL